MTRPSPIQFRDADLETAIRHRTRPGQSPGLVAQRDLDRLYTALRAELAALSLSEPEALLICDACNGTLFDTSSIPLLWAEVEDAIWLDGLDQKWRVDGPALVQRLRSLSYAQSLAVVDAVERWWLLPGNEQARRSVRLRSVGLIC